MHAGSGDTTRPAHDVDGTRYQVAAWRQLAADVEAHPASSLEDLNARSRRALDLCVCGHGAYDHAPACAALTALDRGCYCPRFMPHPQPVGMHRTPELRNQEGAHAGSREVDTGDVVVGVNGDQDGARGVGDLRFAGSKLGALGDDLRAVEGGLYDGRALGGGGVSAGHDLGAVDSAGEGSAVAAGSRDLGGRGAGGLAAGVTPTTTQEQEQSESAHGASGPASYRETPALWTVNVWSDGNTTGTGPHGRVWWNVDVHCGAVYRFAIYGSATREQAERDGIAFVRREDDRASITIHRKAPRPSLLAEMADANWEGDPMEALMLMRTLTEDVRDRVLFELKRREETYNALPDTVWVGEAATMKDLEDEFICRVFAALEGGAL